MESCPVSMRDNVCACKDNEAHSQRDHATRELLTKLLTWSGVFEDKVLIIKLPAIDGLATGAIVVGEVASLAHKLRDDSMKAASLKAKALLVRAQAAEILCKRI